MDVFAIIQKVALFAPPVLLAITVHEAAHGWAANKLGDATARMLGRVTLNPFKHIDMIGTVLVPMLTMITGFIFGWAKPVPVNWRNLDNPRRDMALVAIAGPTANLFMAVAWSLLINIGVLMLPFSAAVGRAMIDMGIVGILINIFLMVLNLMPILPLDGGRVMSSVLPQGVARGFARLEPYGLIVIILLLVTGILGKILIPVASFFLTLLPLPTFIMQRFLQLLPT